MRTLKKALGELVDGDRGEWDRHLQAMALAHKPTPHIATGISPFFLEDGKEAVLPVLYRNLDDPRLDPLYIRWLARLWRGRAQM